jgi:hypothetical protein
VGATGDPTPSCIDVGLEGDLAVYDSLKNERRLYKVDRVFDEGADQVSVYEDTQPLIRSVLDGGWRQTALGGDWWGHGVHGMGCAGCHRGWVWDRVHSKARGRGLQAGKGKAGNMWQQMSNRCWLVAT